MKLLFFLLALCLILVRAYIAIDNHGGRKDKNNLTITVSSGDYYEQVKWSGQIILSDDEKSIVSVPPGGYLKFKENDARLVAESNLQGEISYTLYNGHETLPLNDSGKNFIAAALQKMISVGFYADGRAQRLNKKGGYEALIAALPRLNMQNLKLPYLELLFSNDSLSKRALSVVIRDNANGLTDGDKQAFLRHITSLQRKDSIVMSAWLDVVSGINPDIQKVQLLAQLIQEDSISSFAFDRIMSISQNINADMDKQTLYKAIADRQLLAEEQWIKLIEAAGEQHADIDKSNLLIAFTQKMPRTAAIKTAYLTTAKKINNDADYGKAVKIIE